MTQPPPATFRSLAAWLVHLLTASGVVWAILALHAVGEGRWKTAFGWMAVAVAVDGVDGTLARRVDVARHAPSFDGALLDNLVDYLNYVAVPAYVVVESSLMPAGLGLPAAGLIGLASAYQFAHRDAKTAEHHFRGFPSYWNVVAFYLVVLRPAPWAALAVVVALACLVFVPVRCVWPSRTPRRRGLTLALTAVWVALIAIVWVRWPRPSPGLVAVSLAYVAYYAAVSLEATVAAARRGRGAAGAA